MLSLGLFQRRFACLGGGAVVIAVLCFSSTLAMQSPKRITRNQSFRIPLRIEVQAFKGTDAWKETYFEQEFSTNETAIIICDMWDRHWCSGATQRVGLIAHKMEPVLGVARAAGILIIHAPSETMDFYKNYPQRQPMLDIAHAIPPPSLGLKSPSLPIDDSDGGCTTPGDKYYKAWTRENPILKIEPQDLISDNGEEIYSLLKQRHIKYLLYMGVHANMCILNRTFGVKQMTNWGFSCVLVRDLTDTMYDPQSWPHVSHQQGTELVIQYIEKYWCPTTVSSELVRALKSY